MIARRTRNGRLQYLTKWRGLGYAESTWETEAALAQDQVWDGRGCCFWLGLLQLPGEREVALAQDQVRCCAVLVTGLSDSIYAGDAVCTTADPLHCTSTAVWLWM